VPTAGVDGVTIGGVVASGVGEFVDGLAAKLRAGTDRSRPLRRVRIPKPGGPGRLRPLGISCVGDRVVVAAARIVLEPVFEAGFLPASYGFSPGCRPVTRWRRSGRPSTGAGSGRSTLASEAALTESITTLWSLRSCGACVIGGR
jgi:hypothetical protein